MSDPHDDKREPEWIDEGGIMMKCWPQPQVSARERLARLAGGLPAGYGLIPAGELRIPEWIGEVTEELAKLEDGETKMAAIRVGRSKGGQASKYLAGLQAAVDLLTAEHPEATVQELWDLIPDAEGEPVGGFIVYRDGNKLIQVDDATGREKAIFFRSFSRYVTRARRK